MTDDRYAPVKYIISWLAWPGLLALCTGLMAYGYQIDKPVIFFNLAYILLAVCLYNLEQAMPHEESWNDSDGQTIPNVLHTLSSKGTVQTLLVFSAVIGLANYITPLSEPGHGLWPREWALWGQVALGLVVAEFGLYWVHRLSHECMAIWKFHAVHHSVTRLWIINTGRFHFVDSLMKIVPSTGLLIFLGAPMEVIIWLSALTAFIGMLTHCNVEMRCGPLSWVFNTPGLHRFHHSRDLREGNMNYGENVVLWDQVFGTYYNAPYRPPVRIGIHEYMPPGFWAQLVWPFQKEKRP